MNKRFSLLKKKSKSEKKNLTHIDRFSHKPKKQQELD
jgi:hypothetical protein